MADNYLERKMEEYRTGPRRMVCNPKPVRSVMVIDGLSERGAALVRSLRASRDCRVAFCGADMKAGSKLAQQTGARFYPVSPADEARVAAAIADAEKVWGVLDEIIRP